MENLTEKVERYEKELILLMKQRMKESIRIKKTSMDVIEIPFHEKAVWFMVNMWDSFERAKNIIKSRDTRPAWKKVLGKILRIGQCVVIIAAGIYSKKLKL